VPPPPPPRRALAAVVAVTALLALLGAALPPPGRVAVIAAAQVLGTAAVLAAVRRYRPARPRVWTALLVAAWAYSLAWYALLLAAGPVVVVLLCLAAYTAMGQVVVAITRQPDSLPSIDRLDVALLAVCASAASLHLTGALDAADGRTVESWVAAQAAGTVVFAATAVWAVVTGRSSAPAVRLLLGVAGGLVLWHLATLALAVEGRYQPGSAVDVLVVPGWGALAAAAWQPSMRVLGRPTAPTDRSFPGSLAVLAAGLTLGVFPVLGQLGGRPVAPLVLVLATTTTVALLLAREVLVARRATSLADGDPLTGLGNRRSLLRRLTARAADPRSPATLLCVLDLDDFQDVNDSRGSAAGDRVLAEVGRRLVERAGPGASAYRLGGDEFAVLVPLPGGGADDGADDGAAGTSATAARLLAAVAQPVGSRDGAVVLRARVGEVLLGPGRPADPGDPGADDPSALFADATAALAEAELALAEARRGEARAVRATEALLSGHRLARDLSEALPAALRAHQLLPHYEPLVQLGTDASADRVRGLEALVRWHHPSLGLLGADRVVPVAERRRLLPAVDLAVLRAALGDCARWRRDVPGWSDLSVAVNASAPSLVHEDLVERVLGELARAGLPGSALTVEITEQALLVDRAGIAARLLELRGAGVRIAADDFGTGFASLDYLISFPLDLLKVDRSLVERAAEPAGRRLLAGVVEVSHALGVSVLAEGVACPADVELARELGFDAVQGFGVGRALPADRVPLGPVRAGLLP